ncbi:hypothetical protein M153_12200003002, partial [Pseudoloma neurophilia]
MVNLFFQIFMIVFLWNQNLINFSNSTFFLQPVKKNFVIHLSCIILQYL